MRTRWPTLLLLAATWLIQFAAPSITRAPAGLLAPPAECAATQIKISEVEADPPTGTVEPADEWIELYNTGTECMLTGWSLADANRGDILPTHAIAAGGNLIVAASAGFLDNHPGFTGAYTLAGGNDIGNGLSNFSDSLRLTAGSSSEADCVSWGTSTCGFNVKVPTPDNTRTLQRTPTDGVDTDTASDWTGLLVETPQGSPTAVTLSTFSAEVAAGRVVLTWSTGNEQSTWGFNLFRAIEVTGVALQLNAALIPAQAPGGLGGAVYTWEDSAGLDPGTTYFYWLEDVDLDRQPTRHGPVRVALPQQLYLPWVGMP